MILFFAIEGSGQVIACWSGDILAARHFAGDRPRVPLPNVRASDTWDFYKVCNLLAAHRVKGREDRFHDTPELRRLIQRLHDFSWSKGHDPDFAEFLGWD